MDFLDFVIGKHTCHVTGGASLFYRVHQKALNKYLYISPFSYHPPHGMKAFIKTELVRYVRHSSCHYDFLVIARRFFARLRERGFNPSFLRPVFDDVNYASRADKLILATPGQVMVPLVFSYVLSHGRMRPILLASSSICMRRPHNLSASYSSVCLSVGHHPAIFTSA